MRRAGLSASAELLVSAGGPEIEVTSLNIAVGLAATASSITYGRVNSMPGENIHRPKHRIGDILSTTRSRK